MITDDGNLIAKVQAKLTSLLAFTTPACSQAIDVSRTSCICQTEVTVCLQIISLTGKLCDGTFQHIIYVFVIFLSQEVSYRNLGYYLHSLQSSILHLTCTIIDVLHTSKCYNIAYLQALLLKVALGTDTVNVCFTSSILDVAITILSFSDLGNDTSQTINGRTLLSLVEVSNRALDDRTQLISYSSNSRALLTSGRSETDAGRTSTTCIGIGMECNLSLCTTGNDTLNRQPALISLRDINSYAFTLYGQSNLEVLTSLIQGILIEFFNLDQRLGIAQNGNVLQLRSTLVSLSWTLNSNLITLLQLQASEVLLTTIGIQCTINIYLTSTIIDIPVTICSIRKLGERTLYLIGFAIITSQDFFTGREWRIQYTLDYSDVLSKSTTYQLEGTVVSTLSGSSIEDNMSCTSVTTRARGSNPGRNRIHRISLLVIGNKLPVSSRSNIKFNLSTLYRNRER